MRPTLTEEVDARMQTAIARVPELEVIESMESEVRSYVRSFPAAFTKAKGPYLWTTTGQRYVDFFSGAGALNYGHNHPTLKAALLEYLESDGITHSLDMATVAKGAFLEALRDLVLAPRGLEYRVQFPGPTGTNAVEAALKLARKVTGRHTIIAFTNAFHGMTIGSLAVSGNRFKRNGAGLPLQGSISVPFAGFLPKGGESLDYLERFLDDGGSGMPAPAGVICETVQGEGGLATASAAWLQRLSGICHRRDLPLIVDDVQAGCGRTGQFFSFEFAGIHPDIVCLSKSLSGYGLPLAVTLIRPDLDRAWEPGEHNGTFRGHNPAFVTGRVALETFWRDGRLDATTQRRSRRLTSWLQELAARYPKAIAGVRGRGLMLGLVCTPPDLAQRISATAFAGGLLVETSGPASEVVKLLPSLTCPDDVLREGFDILSESVARCVASA